MSVFVLGADNVLVALLEFLSDGSLGMNVLPIAFAYGAGWLQDRLLLWVLRHYPHHYVG